MLAPPLPYDLMGLGLAGRRRFIRHLRQLMQAARQSGGLAQLAVTSENIAYVRGAAEAIERLDLGSDPLLVQETRELLAEANGLAMATHTIPTLNAERTGYGQDADLSPRVAISRGSPTLTDSKLAVRLHTVECFSSWICVRWLVASQDRDLDQATALRPAGPIWSSTTGSDAAALIAASWKQRVEDFELVDLTVIDDHATPYRRTGFDFHFMTPRFGVGSHFFKPGLPKGGCVISVRSVDPIIVEDFAF